MNPIAAFGLLALGALVGAAIAWVAWRRRADAIDADAIREAEQDIADIEREERERASERTTEESWHIIEDKFPRH